MRVYFEGNPSEKDMEKVNKMLKERDMKTNNTEISKASSEYGIEEILREVFKFNVSAQNDIIGRGLVEKLTTREADIRQEAVEGFWNYLDEERGDIESWHVENYLKENKDE